MRPVSTARYLDATGVPLLVARLVLGGMFIYMGTAKLHDPIKFLKDIRAFGILSEDPPYYMNATAAVLPWVEVLCGLALFVGLAIRGASLTLLIVLMIFTTAVTLRALGEYTGTKPFCEIAFDCGCGTGVVKVCKKLVENVALIVLALIAMGSHSRRFCLSHLFWPRPFKELRSCVACGYPLYGLMGKTCPDCGAPREAYVRKPLGRV
jgi:uncharacterized membrane protein YphA (DoxX/SURF4 family)